MALGINSNLSGLSSSNYLLKAGKGIHSAMQKLSSGLKINQAKDNPAGLVISELLRSQLGGLTQAVQNTQEANNVLGIAEGGLQEMSTQLRSMRELALHALNTGVTGRQQISADQAELNSGLQAISRMASSTSYAGQNLLDGSQAITYGVNDPAAIVNASATEVTAMNSDTLETVNVQFSGAAEDQAERATLETDLGGTDTLAAAQEFTVTGPTGSAQFSFEAGTSITDMVDAINARSDQTGMTAYATDGNTEMRLASNEYGADQRITVEQTEGDALTAAGTTATDTGQNAVVTVNGTEYEADGLEVNVAGSDMTGTITLNAGDVAGPTVAQTGYDQDTLTNATTAQTASLTNIQGGMQFQLGEGAGVQERDTLGLESMSLSNLGQVTVDGESYALSDLFSGGSASLASDPATALKVIDQAIADVSNTRASIGAYQTNTLQANANSLSVAIENVTSTESSIRDADIAEEVSNLVRYQLLEKVGLMGVQSANTNAANVLKLLGGGN